MAALPNLHRSLRSNWRPPVAELTDQIEALLFVASEPLTPRRLATATGTTVAATTAALSVLEERLTGGIRLSHHDTKYRLVTAPHLAGVIRGFLQAEAKTELSRAALETLAIIAYRAPITRAAIEQIRGVASETMLRNLTARGLIQPAGKSSGPGRPQLYTVSHSFLQHFGLTSLQDLPPNPAPETSGNPQQQLNTTPQPHEAPP
jgi:segregation and condensation protein B